MLKKMGIKSNFQSYQQSLSKKAGDLTHGNQIKN